MFRLIQFALCLLLLNILTPAFSGAQTIDEIFKKFTKGYHTYAGTKLPFYLFMPAGYDSVKKYPMVLCLHGSGERGDNETVVRLNTMATVWARDTNQNKYPCFIVVPQCPANGTWVYSLIVDQMPITSELRTVISIMDSLTIRYSVDTNRLYVTGLSMGGYGTWNLIQRFPWKFAAAVPICGGGDASKADLIKKTPIWNFHGEKDNVVSVTNSRVMISALEGTGRTAVYTNCKEGNCQGLSDSAVSARIRNGADLLYTEYMNATHNVWDNAYNNKFLLPWVFSWNKLNSQTIVAGRNASAVPEEYRLLQNYPNPFNPTTKIRYEIPVEGVVTLKVFDMLGKTAGTIVNEYKAAGSYEVTFNASDLTSGLYLYRIVCGGGYSATRKMTVVK